MKTGAAEEYKTEYLEDNKDVQYLNLILDFGEIDYSGDLNEMSFAEYTWGHSGGYPVHYVSVPGVGYGNIAASFAAPFLSKIKLGAKVTGINYEDQNNVIVSFTENGVARKVVAKTVLVSASLGVLKAGSISFTPSLPGWKQEVIDNMGFGLANKCLMQWNDEDDMVWPEEKAGFELITPSSDTSGKWTTFFNPSKLKGVPLLEGLIGGDDARDMEMQTDEEIIDDVMKNLRAMFPTISRPDRVIITRWGQEENIRGAYAFKVKGRDFDDDAWNLQRSVGKIWFAGEAMSGTWYGTAVGAWETGEEAAQEMAEEIAALASSSSVSSVPSSSASVSSSHVWYSALFGVVLVCFP